MLLTMEGESEGGQDLCQPRSSHRHFDLMAGQSLRPYVSNQYASDPDIGPFPLSSNPFGHCSLCMIELSSISIYRKHMNECHPEAKVWPFSCSVCGKGFLSQPSLAQHQALHQNKKKFTCFMCDAKTSSKWSLRRHYEGVHNMKECRYCGSVIKCGVDFNQHIISCHNKGASWLLKLLIHSTGLPAHFGNVIDLWFKMHFHCQF